MKQEVETLRQIADNIESGRPAGYNLFQTILFPTKTDRYNLAEVPCKAKTLRDINFNTLSIYAVVS